MHERQLANRTLWSPYSVDVKALRRLDGYERYQALRLRTS
jgi:hypothetical protein